MSDVKMDWVIMLHEVFLSQKFLVAFITNKFSFGKLWLIVLLQHILYANRDFLLIQKNYYIW